MRKALFIGQSQTHPNATLLIHRELFLGAESVESQEDRFIEIGVGMDWVDGNHRRQQGVHAIHPGNIVTQGHQRPAHPTVDGRSDLGVV